jgi:hypothetical protein
VIALRRGFVSLTYRDVYDEFKYEQYFKRSIAVFSDIEKEQPAYFMSINPKKFLKFESIAEKTVEIFGLPGGCLPPFELNVAGSDNKATWITKPEGFVMQVGDKMLYWDLSKFDPREFPDRISSIEK